MKGYVDYMNNISAGSELHEKIMQRVTQNQTPRRQNSFALRYVAAAACVAIFALCIWLIPGLPGGPQNVAPPAAPITPAHPITLNEIEAYMPPSRIFIDGHFWHDLTSEQLVAVLPDLGFPVVATAHYYGDGRLFEVNIAEMLPGGDTAIIGEFYPQTIIRVSPIGISRGYLMDYEPIISNVHGVAVTAGVFDRGVFDDGILLFFAYFEIDGIFYGIDIHDYATRGQERLAAIVNAIILGGAADLSGLADPVIPELRSETLTLAQARQDPDFGAYLPVSVPPGFVFSNATRELNQAFNGLSAFWDTGGRDVIWWQISAAAGHHLERVVSVNDREKFDLALYPIPWMDSVPPELRDVVANPVFRADEITLDAVRARVLMDGRGGGSRINFSVLYGDVVISIDVGGISPEQLWEMLPGIA